MHGLVLQLAFELVAADRRTQRCGDGLEEGDLVVEPRPGLATGDPDDSPGSPASGNGAGKGGAGVGGLGSVTSGETRVCGEVVAGLDAVLEECPTGHRAWVELHDPVFPGLFLGCHGAHPQAFLDSHHTGPRPREACLHPAYGGPHHLVDRLGQCHPAELGEVSLLDDPQRECLLGGQPGSEVSLHGRQREWLPLAAGDEEGVHRDRDGGSGDEVPELALALPVAALAYGVLDLLGARVARLGEVVGGGPAQSLVVRVHADEFAAGPVEEGHRAVEVRHRDEVLRHLHESRESFEVGVAGALDRGNWHDSTLPARRGPCNRNAHIDTEWSEVVQCGTACKRGGDQWSPPLR